MIIALDGPAASGKSTAARALAERLGYVFLDTGAMYRAVTREVLARGLDPADGEAAAGVAAQLSFEHRAGGGPGDPRARLVIRSARGGPELADAELRTAAVTGHVSEVAAHPGVRRVLVAHQQALGRAARAAGGGCVAEGRDTTTVVFPDADHKFFLVASPAERARRRALEEGEPGRAEAIQREIERRDAYDSSRADSPLLQHPDALVLVTDGLDAEAVLAALLEVVRA